MRHSLDFVGQLLVRARRLQDNGRPQDALPLLVRLSRQPDLSAEVVAEVHRRLAELRLARGLYRKARRHLSLVLALNAGDARTHFRLGQAYDRDPKAEPRLAMRHYRQSLHLNPDQADCLAAMGELALRMERTDEGIAALRKAVELRPDEPSVLATLVDALGQEGRWDEAGSVARLARFRGPLDARFQAIWDDYCFARAAAEQASDRDTPAVLSFDDRPAPSVRELHGKRWRLDRASRPAGHLPRTARRPDPRRTS